MTSTALTHNVHRSFPFWCATGAFVFLLVFLAARYLSFVKETDDKTIHYFWSEPGLIIALATYGLSLLCMAAFLLAATFEAAKYRSLAAKSLVTPSLPFLLALVVHVILLKVPCEFCGVSW